MFIDYLKQTHVLNQIDLRSVKGKRLYYNKTRNIISLGLFGVFYLIILSSCLSLASEDEQFWIPFAILFGLITASFTFKIIGNLRLKNPVFILQGEEIYYIRTNQWYKLMDHDFTDEYIGRYNYYGTFCMTDKKGKRILSEKNWYLKDEEAFKSHVKYNKLILLQSNNR